MDIWIVVYWLIGVAITTSLDYCDFKEITLGKTLSNAFILWAVWPIVCAVHACEYFPKIILFKKDQ